MSAGTRKPTQFTGWHMLGVMVLFFGTIVGVNLFMATSAFRTWTGLVVQNTYVASQGFNDRLAAQREIDALGWTPDLAYDGETLRFTLTAGTGLPLDIAGLTADIHRPVGVRGEQIVSLEADGRGGYIVPVALADGVWNVQLRGEISGYPDYEHYARLTVGGGA
jgi:nitrogen fixation protein FixH